MNAIDASPVGVFYDDAHYVILGRSLATGEGYRYLNVPGAPAATHFPPGYPALLALLWGLSPSFPENVVFFKMVNALLLGGVALGVYWMAKRLLQMTTGAALLASSVSTIAIPALLMSSNVMSETLFLALLLPLLVAAEDSSRLPGARRAALLGIGAALLCLIRLHAVVLMPAIAIAYMQHRRYREAAVAVGASVIVVLPWFVWVRHYDPMIPPPLRGQYGSYGAWLLDGLRANGPGLLFTSIRDNAVTSFAIIARSFSLARNAVLDVAAVIAVLTLCGAGAIAFARRARVTLVFMSLYLIVALAWPFSPLRFIWGVWPLLVLLMVSGVLYLWRLDGTERARRVARGVCVASAAIAAIGAVNFNVRGYANAWWSTMSHSHIPRIQPQLVWVTENSGRDDVIVADDEGAVYLYTGRRAVPANTFTVEQHFRIRSPKENARWMAEIVRTFAPAYVVAWAKPTLDAAMILATMRPPVLMQVDTLPTGGGKVFRRME